MPTAATMPAEPVSILVPAYNEQDGIQNVIEELRRDFVTATGRTPEQVEIIIVNDGSTDATGERSRATGARVIEHPENLGYGASLKTGLRAASHEIIVITDADGTYPAVSIQPLLETLQQCDMAVGQRSGERVHYPWNRRPAKWLLLAIAQYLAQRRIPDLNSGLRVFRKADALRFLNLYPSGFSFTTTITLAYLSSDLLVRYLPINYNPRTGKSKIRPIRDTKNLLLTIIRSIFFFNPLRVCIPVSVVLVALAIYVLKVPRDVHGNVYDGTVAVLLLSAVQVTIAGLIADMIARTR